MPRIVYKNKNFSPGTLAIIRRANDIISEYQKLGFILTLRQLYYQFVSRDWIANKQTEYKRLGGIVNEARLAGLIDWGSIEDRGRNVNRIASWDSPNAIVAACVRSYQRDLWEGQDCRPEVWIEKEALLGVIQPVCERERVNYFACKGYTSQSEMWNAGHNRFAGGNQMPVVIHLGDHDPSGIDMTRDIADRISMFSGGLVEVRRIALTWPQIVEYKPPPNPAKMTDSRFRAYAKLFGEDSWELDALSPNVIARLISAEVAKLRDKKLWGVQVKREEAEVLQLRESADALLGDGNGE